MKIVSILGARPQFVKAAALSRAIRKKGFKEVIIHTGQHYDSNMSDVFFDQMQIPRPDHFLNITSQHHGDMTGRMLQGIEKVLQKEMPDIVMTFGDTNSTLAGALAARKMQLKVAHIEAGLRSFNMRMPEEINRILSDRISDFLFCPGEHAVDNLMKEGFANFSCQIHVVGDIMKDVAFFYRAFAEPPSFEVPNDFALTTIHRAENTDEPARLEALITALNLISLDLPVILPLHPRTRSRLASVGAVLNSNVMVVEPVGYLQMIYLLAKCNLVITDSGGLQKEAYFFQKPCITTRDETEWIELVDAGYNRVVGVNVEKIIEAKQHFLKGNFAFDLALYGEGNTAERIIDILDKELNDRKV